MQGRTLFKSTSDSVVCLVAGQNEEFVDIEDIPEWAMEVVEAPTPPAPSVLYSPKAAEERNNSVFGPVPIPAGPPDLTPLLMKSDGSVRTGETVWQGVIGFAEQKPFRAQCIAIAGKLHLGAILLDSHVTPQTPF